MDPKDILKNTIPNPFSEQSTLSGLAKKGELLGEGLSFTTIIKNVVFLLILAFVLVGYFKISASIVSILVGTEILITLIAGYIKIRKITDDIWPNRAEGWKEWGAMIEVSLEGLGA